MKTHFPNRNDRTQDRALVERSWRAIEESWELMRALPATDAEIRAVGRRKPTPLEESVPPSR